MMREKKNIENLLIAYVLHELNETQTQEVAQWISESTENQKQFDEVSQVWAVSENAIDLNLDSDKAWNKVAVRMKTKTLWQNHWLQAAASILFLVGMYTTIINLAVGEAESILFSNTQIVTDTLMDGSVITLNKNSSLVYTDNFNNKTREVTLKGEAFFDIERDTTKPFIIHLEDSRVKVLGTSFNIKSTSKDKLVSVYVSSGVVLFEYLSDTTGTTYLSVKLLKGDKASYNKVTNQIEVFRGSEAENLDMYWLNQELVFDGIQLGKVTKILETVYDVQIDYTNEQSKTCLLTVSFKNAKIDEIMDVIATTFDLDLVKTDKKYILKGLSCEER
jgi:ferric-dicitrate binding protein FerR (iron transport regulator)